jgi:hypothetical protein
MTVTTTNPTKLPEMTGEHAGDLGTFCAGGLLEVAKKYGDEIWIEFAGALMDHHETLPNLWFYLTYIRNEMPDELWLQLDVPHQFKSLQVLYINVYGHLDQYRRFSKHLHNYVEGKEFYQGCSEAQQKELVNNVRLLTTLRFINAVHDGTPNLTGWEKNYLFPVELGEESEEMGRVETYSYDGEWAEVVGEMHDSLLRAAKLLKDDLGLGLSFSYPAFLALDIYNPYGQGGMTNEEWMEDNCTMEASEFEEETPTTTTEPEDEILRTPEGKIIFTNLSEINEFAKGLFEGMKPEKATLPELEMFRTAVLVYMEKDLKGCECPEMAAEVENLHQFLFKWIEEKFGDLRKDDTDVLAMDRLNKLIRMFVESTEGDHRHRLLCLCALAYEVSEAIVQRGRDIEAETDGADPSVRRTGLVNGNTTVEVMKRVQDLVLANF